MSKLVNYIYILTDVIMENINKIVINAAGCFYMLQIVKHIVKKELKT